MVNFTTSDEWQRQSELLLQARPVTTRVTTKYNIPNLESPKFQKAQKRKRDADSADKDKEKDAPKIPRATFTLKTYDPESGVVLKFKTDRAAEVGRLIAGLGRVGRQMAALPEKEQTTDVPMEDPIAPVEDSTPATTSENKPQQSTGGGKKKKKNKK